jgi:selenocysteine lyase/cysteine desulfurase
VTATTSPADRINSLRAGILGADAVIETPFGQRPILYADYTASGRSVRQVEDQIKRLSGCYANPHTTDSATGRASGTWLRDAESLIKELVNAGPDDCLITCGAGATAAIHKLQEILGVAIPPATQARIQPDLAKIDRPVVFVGPYEHHSNELSWRESLAEVVSIGLNADGGIDLDHLAAALADTRFAGRQKIGAFSAASNVTGVKTDLSALARLLHAHDAILCLDCAASAPYQLIDMHPEDDPDASIDAVYFSPHKFVGGPGACGLLLFNAALYRTDLAPTLSAGGTVKYVWKDGHDFIDGIEARERAGTPGVPQVVRAALAMQIQAEIGGDAIASREHAALDQAFEVWSKLDHFQLLGPDETERRLGIVSFNIQDPRGGILHPRFVTVLLNDLFGIQSRAGCSCAGPYGHDLLGIDDETTLAIRKTVLDGQAGLRPGWCRVSLHWLMSDVELDYLIRAVSFVAQSGWRFLDLYRFAPETGAWAWRGGDPESAPGMPISVLDTPLHAQPAAEHAALFAAAQKAAVELAAELEQGIEPECGWLADGAEAVRYFSLPGNASSPGAATAEAKH